MSTLMRFEKGAQSLQFEAGGDYPATREHEVLQVTDRTAAGTPQTETLGINLITRIVDFNLMSKTDYDALVNWFLNIVNAGGYPFDFTDEYGDTGEVRFLDTKIRFPETAFQTYSGSITLEYT